MVIQGKKLVAADEDVNADVVNEAEEGYVTEETDADTADRRNRTNRKEGSYKRIKLARELSDLVNYCKSTRFVDFQTSARKRKILPSCAHTQCINMFFSYKVYACERIREALFRDS